MKYQESEDNYGLENLEDIDSYKEYTEKSKVIEESFWVKLERVGNKITFAKDLKALFSYFRDPYIRWYRKTIVVAALIYFISPFDAIPDMAPLVGYLDDLGVITALLKYLGSEILPYYEK